MSLPLDTSVEAEYSDGYIHSETDLNDVSPYEPTQNILNDIIYKRPETEHGKLVRFSVYFKDHRYDIDWTTLPDNARPIRFRQGFRTLHADGHETSGWLGVNFGYQYNDKDGKNHQEIREL